MHHGSLLKSYGFKLKKEIKGPSKKTNAPPGAQWLEVSLWKHHKLGYILLKHIQHKFGYHPLPKSPEEKIVWHPKTYQKIGKNNVVLEVFLKTLFSTQVLSEATLSFPPKAFGDKVEENPFEPLMPEALFPPPKSLHQAVAETMFPDVEELAVPIKDGETTEGKYWKPAPGQETKIKILPPQSPAVQSAMEKFSQAMQQHHEGIAKNVTKDIVDPPIKIASFQTAQQESVVPNKLKVHGMVEDYVHAVHNHVAYHFDGDNFKSNQGKTFSISTVKWMINQGIIIPVTEVPAKAGAPFKVKILKDKSKKEPAYKATLLPVYTNPLPGIIFNKADTLSVPNWTAFKKQIDEVQQKDFTDNFEFIGSAANMGGAHSKYRLKDKNTDTHFLFKPARTIGGKTDDLLAYADLLASDITAILRPETHIPVFVGTMNIPGEGKVFGSFQPIVENCQPLSLDILKGDKFIPQLQQEHVIDWLISNHDAHSKHFIIKDEKLYGIDKTQAYKFFPDDELSKTYHPNTQEAAPYYNAFFNSGMQENPSCIYDIVITAMGIPDIGFKQLLVPYAVARYKKIADINLFLHAACQRKNHLKEQLEAFYGTEIKAPVKPVKITQHGPQDMIDALATKGYTFYGFGAKSKLPKYKDNDGKTVYLIGANGWEYYPMGSSSLNPYGASSGKGIDKLIEALNQPFEKPEIPDSDVPSVHSKWTGEDAEKFHALPVLVLKTPKGFATGGDPVKHITVTGSFTHQEQKTITSYKGSGFHSINQFLYLGQEAHGGSYLAESVSHLNSALAKSKTNKNLVLWRGLQGTYSDQVRKQLLAGDKILQPNSFQSCSTSQSFSHNWSGSHSHSPKVVLRITIPAGVPAVAPNSVTSMYQSEKELILSHTVIFEVQGLYQYEGALYADVLVSQHKPAAEEVVEEAIEEQAAQELASVGEPALESSISKDLGKDLGKLNKLSQENISMLQKMFNKSQKESHNIDEKLIWVEPTTTKTGIKKPGYYKSIKTKKKVL